MKSQLVQLISAAAHAFLPADPPVAVSSLRSRLTSASTDQGERLYKFLLGAENALIF